MLTLTLPRQRVLRGHHKNEFILIDNDRPQTWILGVIGKNTNF